jgi:hypothetical protein
MQQVVMSIARLGNFLGIGGFWFAVWFYRAVLVSVAGGLVGVLATPLIKLLFFRDATWLGSFGQGFLIGCQYAGIWATGIAMIWVIVDRKSILAVWSRWLSVRNPTEGEQA